MPLSLRTLVKTFTQAIFVIAICTLGQTVARADELTLAGFTNGCFGPCTPPSTSGQQTATLVGLTYNNSTFSGTTSNNFLAIGDTPQLPGSQNIDNLGSFTLTGSPHVYTGQTFTLRVTFTVPAGIAGSNTTTYQSILTGSVTANSMGGVFIHFTTPPQVFTFNNGQATGSFTFTVTDVNVIAGGLVPLTGNVIGSQQSTIPEPATLLLLGTGLAGAAARTRRRRSGSRK